ncbi:MAG TPA: O-methyltransferase [Amycolatopsis sp.]|uniref:O-methyltransferase n=1 Tax=Amycolatopsis sp. TaxID=37632 RepID=UPI002B4A29C6|nr:O-methyltransferase [Amycolatopsis sp.]HKS47398.1 O-methyltransferase [Amycolatopsis sp.]
MDDKLWAEVDNYLTSQLIKPDPVLAEARANSDAAGLPSIAVAENQGKFLNLLARFGRVRTALELGTLGGYSTIWLGRALPEDGRLLTLEANPKHAEVARANIAAAGLAGIVEVRVGAALDLLPGIDEAFDLIFIDADKNNYPEYFRWSLRLSHRGTLIIADNVVRQGKVADATTSDPLVLGVRRMHELIAAEPRVEATALQTVGIKGHDGFAVVLVTS